MSIQFEIFLFHLKEGFLPSQLKNQDNSFAWSKIKVNCPIYKCFVCTVEINALHEQIGI